MSEEDVDNERRKFITNVAAVAGSGGIVAAASPFVISLQPSDRAKAVGAPVEADVSHLQPGQMMTVRWRGKPVWILRRTPEELEQMNAQEGQLRDPQSLEPQQPPYAKNPNRSIKPEYLVLVGICTHLGCSPLFKPAEATDVPVDDWKGGFFCPCHGSRFDLAGRVFDGVPAPSNMAVPPHKYLSDTRLIIGMDEEGIAS